MPITQLDFAADTAQRRCNLCGAIAPITLSTLQLGISRKAPSTILLPACPCGAQEQLLRNMDSCPSDALGTPFDLQRRAVNTLAQHLLDTGRVNPDCADHWKVQPVAPDMLPSGTRYADLYPPPPVPPPLDQQAPAGQLTDAYKALQAREEAATTAARQAATDASAAVKGPMVEQIAQANATLFTQVAQQQLALAQAAVDAGDTQQAMVHAAAAEGAAQVAGTDDAQAAADSAREAAGEVPRTSEEAAQAVQVQK